MYYLHFSEIKMATEIQRNDVFSVYFYENLLQKYATDIMRHISDFGRITLEFHELHIKKDWFLVKDGDRDLRGKTKAELEEILRYGPGVLINWTVLVNDSDNELRYSTNIRVRIYF